MLPGPKSIAVLACLWRGVAVAAETQVDLVLRDSEFPAPKKVGTVTVSDSGQNLVVTYQISLNDPNSPSDRWCMNEAKLDVETSVYRLPNRNGALDPSRFAYQTSHDCAQSFTYTIPITWDCDDRLEIAAYAEVTRLGGLEGLPFLLPSQAKASIQHVNPNSYFQITTSD